MLPALRDRRVLTALILTAVALAVIACGAPRESAARVTAHRASAGAGGGRVVSESFYSRALNRRRSYLAYLPAGYAAATRRGVRFPVFYLMHSAVGRPSGMVETQHVERILQAEIAAGRARPMILVWPDGRIPGVSSDSEFANIRYGRYMDGVIDTIHAADRRFATIASRRGRLLGGISTGGYAAANICLHHLALCGGFESWGGYFVQTREFPFDREPLANLRANSPAGYVGGLRRGLARDPVWGFAYQGTSDHTVSEMPLFFHRFLAAGGRGGYAYYPGGHGWGIWRRELPHMYDLASAHLAAPR